MKIKPWYESEKRGKKQAKLFGLKISFTWGEFIRIIRSLGRKHHDKHDDAR